MNTVLPANATPLELALTDSTDVLTRLGPDADHIARFKSVPGDPLLPFLIWEYGLGELQPYIADSRELIQQGLLWQRLRGTPAAVRMALSWINIQAELEESGRGSNWPVYQLFLKGMDDIEAVRHVRKLATLSHPVRCRLGRVYNELFDNRFIVWSERSKWSNYWWSFESGVDDNGLLVSLGKRHPAFAGPLDVQAESHLTSRYMMYARYVYDCWRWSFSRWSDAFSRRHGFLVGSVLTVGPQRQEQPWRFRWRSLTRAQLTWAGANDKVGTWGDINCRWGTPAYPVLDYPALWGKARWGDLQRHQLVVTPEKFEATQILAAPANFLITPTCFGESLLQVRASTQQHWLWSQTGWSEHLPAQRIFVPHSLLVSDAHRPEPLWRFRHRALSRAQLTWSGTEGKTGTWGDINCRWGNRAQVQLAEPPRWGCFRWGDCTKRHIDVQHEMFLHNTPVFVDTATSVAVPSVLTAQQGCRAVIHDNDKWSGEWDERRWHPWLCRDARLRAKFLSHHRNTIVKKEAPWDWRQLPASAGARASRRCLAGKIFVRAAFA